MTLTYIPNISSYRLEEEHIALHTDQIVQMQTHILADFLGCSLWNAEDIQDTLRDERPKSIHLVDDSVYYLY